MSETAKEFLKRNKREYRFYYRTPQSHTLAYETYSLPKCRKKAKEYNRIRRWFKVTESWTEYILRDIITPKKKEKDAVKE